MPASTNHRGARQREIHVHVSDAAAVTAHRGYSFAPDDVAHHCRDCRKRLRQPYLGAKDTLSRLSSRPRE